MAAGGADRSITDHLRGIALFRGVLDRIVPDDLARSTPCAGWAVSDLLAHQLGQDLAFTSALRGGASRASDWAPADIGDDAPARLHAALVDQQAALRDLGDPTDAVVWMPEILPSAPLPAGRALDAHLIDLVVHSWDLAAGVGADLAVPGDILAHCVDVARAIPDTEQTRGPGRAFARGRQPSEARQPSEGGAPLDELLRRLGRDPAWAPPHVS